MKNELFTLAFDKTRGILTSLILNSDPEKANFIKEGHGLGEIHATYYYAHEDGRHFKGEEKWELQHFTEGERESVAAFSRRGVRVTETFLLREEDLLIRMEIQNTNPYPVYFMREEFSVYVPLADSYDDSLTCQRIRCHEHIAACMDNTYVRAERMGISEHNLGLVFLRGAADSYSQENCYHSNDRGHLYLNIEPFSLLSGEKYVVEFAVFSHRGGEDFFAKASAYPEFIRVLSPSGYVLVEGEDCELVLKVSQKPQNVRVLLGNRDVPYTAEDCLIKIPLKNMPLGENTVAYEVDGRRGTAVYFVSQDLEKLQRQRAHFIVEHQQCLASSSPLYGAYLIYDNEEERQYFSYEWTDHNANRERMGMAVFLIKYMRKTGDRSVESSLALFTEFLLRECVDEDTGRVYNNIGKDATQKRLYNAPWVFLYFCELYLYYREKRWVELAFKMIIAYYENGGTHFYPNGIRFSEIRRALERSGMHREYRRVLELFDEHIENLIKNGTNYPPHEVNYEQTIVTPAVCLMLDKYLMCGEERYLAEAKKHLPLLEKFHGCQPDYRLYRVPIRYWDNYCFGKPRINVYGDTMPHAALAHSAHCFYAYGILTDDQKWIDYGIQTFRAGLCFFDDKGRASSAYVYPVRVNGEKGAFFDPFANEQDGFLYLAYKLTEDL